MLAKPGAAGGVVNTSDMAASLVFKIISSIGHRILHHSPPKCERRQDTPLLRDWVALR